MTMIQNTPREIDGALPNMKWEAKSYCKGYDGYWMEVLHYGSTKEESIKDANNYVAEHIMSGEIMYGTVVLEGVRVLNE